MGVLDIYGFEIFEVSFFIIFINAGQLEIKLHIL